MKFGKRKWSLDTTNRRFATYDGNEDVGDRYLVHDTLTGQKHYVSAENIRKIAMARLKQIERESKQ